jgi:putative SOS response-associated peptidase YedK
MAILTGAAPPDLAVVHDRAPVVMEPRAWSQWLDPQSPAAVVRDLLRPTPTATIALWPVADRVGDVRANGPDLLARVTVDEQPPLF